jgi:hypothetical protein
MLIGPFSGIQTSWFFQRSWLPFQLWSRPDRHWAAVALVSSRNGMIVSPPSLSNCFCIHTGSPFGLSTGCGSSKPRTPRSAPK